MCYNINYLTKKKEEYARRLQGLINSERAVKDIADIQSKTGPVYFVNGFNHPDVPVITNEANETIQAFTWGLIPFWVKDPQKAVSLSKMTLNARGEDIFDKPSFRNAARKKRCLVLVDGFFEYHWKDDHSYPHYIRMSDNQPMILAGLWETWKYPQEGIERNTFSIVTTRANSMMAHIHNKPKGSEGPRMPVIVPEGMEGEWLREIRGPGDRQRIEEVIAPYEDSELEAFTVPRLQGKHGVGNTAEAIKEFRYAELPD